MKKKLSILTATGFIALTALSATAFAYDGQGSGQHMRRGGMPMAQQSMDYSSESPWNGLSPEQQDQLQALHQNFIDETASIKTELFTKKANMRILMNTSSPDAAELKKLAGQIGDLKAEIMEKRIDFMLKAKKVAPDFRFGRQAGFGGMHHGTRGYCPFGGGMNFQGPMPMHGGMNFQGRMPMHRGGFERGQGAGCWR